MALPKGATIACPVSVTDGSLLVEVRDVKESRLHTDRLVTLSTSALGSEDAIA